MQRHARPRRRRSSRTRQTAEALKPYYRFLCKRPCFSDEYLPTFNRANVTLVDVSDTKGVERITASGIVAHGVEHEVDCIIFASGFEITTDLDRRLGIAAVRRPRRPVALRLLGQGLPHPARHHQPRLPQPVLHRVHPGRRDREHDRDVRAAGQPHRLHRQRGAGARRVHGGTHGGSGGAVVRRPSGRPRSTTPTSSGNAPPATTTTRASRAIRSHLGEPYWPGFYAMEDLLAVPGATRARLRGPRTNGTDG